MRLHPVSIPYRALTESTNLLIGAVVGGVVVLQGEIIAAVSTVGLVFAGVFGYLLIREALYYYRFSYSLGEDTLEIDSGIISRRQREIPFGRIQNIDIVQDPLARIVGIAVVTVETAGGDGTEAALKYVDHDEAERIRRDVQHQKRSDDDDETAETDSSGVENAADTELPKDDTWVAEPPAGETMANGGNQSTTRLHPFTAPLEALRLGFLAASSAFFLVAIGSGFVPSLDIDLLFVLFPLGFVLGAGYAIARYFRFEYELTGDTFDISSGVFARQHREIPVHRVQNIDIGRSLFQRLVGLAVVSVETAGGGESEARLKFVDHETARRLQNEIRQRKRSDGELATKNEGPTGETDPEAVADSSRQKQPDSEALFALSTDRLALLGIASFDLNSAGLLAFVGAFAAPAFVDGGVLSAIALFTSLSNVLIGLLAVAAINAAVVIARHYDFLLVRVGDELRYEHGLLNRRSGTIPVEKIQRVSLYENVLMRQLGFATLKIETAGYASGQSNAIGAQTAVPIARREEVLRVMRAIEGFDTGFETGGERVDHSTDSGFNRPPKRARARYLSRYIVAIGLVTGVLYAVSELAGIVDTPWSAPLALLLFAPVAAHLKWLHRGYRIGEDHVLTRNGFWRRSIHVVPYYRLQTANRRETVFQRRWGLASVVIDTAGSFATRFSPAQAVDFDRSEAQSLRETVRKRLHERVGVRSATVAANGE
jgi:putative membrane protein